MLPVFIAILTACLAVLGLVLLTVYRAWCESHGGAPVWRRSVSAEFRARQLMRETLTPSEYQQATRFGYVDFFQPVAAARDVSRAGGRRPGEGLRYGAIVMELCLQPAEPLPDGDIVVLHKLMILGNESDYLQRANRFAPGIISLRYGESGGRFQPLVAPRRATAWYPNRRGRRAMRR